MIEKRREGGEWPISVVLAFTTTKNSWSKKKQINQLFLWNSYFSKPAAHTLAPIWDSQAASMHAQGPAKI